MRSSRARPGRSTHSLRRRATRIIGGRHRRGGPQGVGMRRITAGIGLAILTLALLAPGSPAHAATPSTPTLTVDPSSPYLDRQVVTVTGRGLAPGEELRVAECEAAGICDWWNGPSGVVGADGSLHLTGVELTRYLDDYFSEATTPPMDCAKERCLLGFTKADRDAEDGYVVRAMLPLTFADVAPVLPTVTVTPSTSLPA